MANNSCCRSPPRMLFACRRPPRRSRVGSATGAPCPPCRASGKGRIAPPRHALLESVPGLLDLGCDILGGLAADDSRSCRSRTRRHRSCTGHQVRSVEAEGRGEWSAGSRPASSSARWHRRPELASLNGVRKLDCAIQTSCAIGVLRNSMKARGRRVRMVIIASVPAPSTGLPSSGFWHRAACRRSPRPRRRLVPSGKKDGMKDAWWCR
jgi:hypothetical protein